ncbi:branched-chain amino acid ABC transporter substrate-binding protein [Bartonella sp. DGB2]|uniref:branched-chain amino acid ABC transporter substrate-binding protein n=1 Tax=Bartonella sp. DGB2 TaxID=3388426 RepID=UPI00399020A6
MSLSFRTMLSALAMGGSLFITSAYADIIVGFIGPLTGPVASYGIQTRNGAKVAIDALNAKGGIDGEKLILKEFDDAADPKQSVSAANQAAGEGVQYVIGLPTSNAAMPASAVLEENGIPLITNGATVTDLSLRGFWNIVRTIGRDDQQGKFAAEYVLKHFNGKKIAILHDRALYGKGLADAFKAAFNAGGGKEVYYGSITPGEKDYSAMVSRLKAANVDYVYFGGYHPEAGLLLKQMREQGVQAPLIGGDGYHTSELWSIAGKAAEGTLFSNSIDPRHNPSAQEAIKQLAAQSILPETFTVNSYAAVQVLTYGIKKVGSADDPEAVLKAIKTGEPIPTILGDITYDKNGDITSRAFAMAQWHNGEIVPADD